MATATAPKASTGTTAASSARACCLPRGAAEPAIANPASPVAASAAPLPPAGADRPIALPGGPFWMGSDRGEGPPADGEGPRRQVVLSPFRIAATVVTNAGFAAFVRATHYVTDAERLGRSFVFHLQLDPKAREAAIVPAGLPWWRIVDHACWQRPEGPGSQVHARPDHPVVHVSWNDAQAYCAWAQGSLPTEAQWEYAARGGLQDARLPWGDEVLGPDGEPRCNIWRGRFPDQPEPGWQPAPMRADAFETNPFGLYNACGNVWEWCA
ncbi:MAG: formylglycine-generating enzyme family protein, partial [Comamonadaceae bacterium]